MKPPDSLAAGKHNRDAPERCFMEAVALLSGERHTDAPRCVSKALIPFCQSYNDAWDDAHRTRLLQPYLFKVMGTRTNEADDVIRRRMMQHWYVTELIPMWLEAAGIADPKLTADLRSFPDEHLTLRHNRCSRLLARVSEWVDGNEETIRRESPLGARMGHPGYIQLAVVASRATTIGVEHAIDYRLKLIPRLHSIVWNCALLTAIAGGELAWGWEDSPDDRAAGDAVATDRMHDLIVGPTQAGVVQLLDRLCAVGRRECYSDSFVFGQSECVL